MVKKQDDDLFSKPTDDGKRITQMIGTIKDASNVLNHRIQVCAVSCILHAVACGDISPANQLCDSLSAGWKVKSLQFWLVDFGPFTIKEGKLGFKPERNETLKAAMNEGDTKEKQEASKVAFIKTRVEASIWADRGTKDEKPFNYGKALRQLNRRAKKIKDDPVKSKNANLDGFDDYAKLVSKTFDKKGMFTPLPGLFGFFDLGPAAQNGLLANAQRVAGRNNGEQEDDVQPAQVMN